MRNRRQKGGEDYEQRKKQKTGIPRLLEMAGQRKTLMIVGASLSTIAALFQLAPYLAVYKVMTELLRNAADISQVDTSYMTFGLYSELSGW